MKKLFLIIGLFGVFTTSIYSKPNLKPNKFAIETDILWPFLVNTTRSHFIFKLWEKRNLKGEIYTGLNIDFPRLRETEGRFADYSLALGYRQYLWKGLHLEYSQTTGLGVLQNHVSTQKDYKSFDWLVSGYLGYKIEFGKNKFYLLPQFGIAKVVFKSNPWPIFENNTLTKEIGEEPFLLGSLRLGYNF